jgi:hypothetical protein
MIVIAITSDLSTVATAATQGYGHSDRPDHADRSESAR